MRWLADTNPRTTQLLDRLLAENARVDAELAAREVMPSASEDSQPRTIFQGGRAVTGGSAEPVEPQRALDIEDRQRRELNEQMYLEAIRTWFKRTETK